jgi:hypothetical protein
VSRRPRGRKYRNLTMRTDAIYYERMVRGRRICRSTRTKDWDQAAAVRDLYEVKAGIGKFGSVPRLEVPTFAALTQRHLVEDVEHLAPTTRSDRERDLRPEGRIVRFFGSKLVTEISAASPGSRSRRNSGMDGS